MSTATNDDIREAYALIGRWDTDGSGTYLDLARVIAAALADERAKARAPFLALAEEYAADDSRLSRSTMAIFRDVARDLRNAAEADER